MGNWSQRGSFRSTVSSSGRADDASSDEEGSVISSVDSSERKQAKVYYTIHLQTVDNYLRHKVEPKRYNAFLKFREELIVANPYLPELPKRGLGADLKLRLFKSDKAHKDRK